MKKVISTLAVGACVAALSACSSTPVAMQPTVVKVPVAASPAPAAPMPAKALSQVQQVVVPSYLDPKSSIATARSVYFDYDKFSVKPEYAGLVELQGKYLASHPALAIRVEGNADSRGSAEYNLALGQKRSEALAKALKIYGVKDTQLESVSWGSEKPRAAGQTEAAYAQNRRADVVYPGQ